jgi:NAD-dependent deacetylase sirtuin 2
MSDNRFKLPKDNPMAIFDIAYFQNEPLPFFMLAKDLFPDPDKYKPTIAHHFIRLLQDKGLLLRHYTQNVDGLERAAGVRDDMMVEAHGSYHKSTCQNDACKAEYSIDDIKGKILLGEVPFCKKMITKEDKKQAECGGVIKPNIIFFGEQLDESYFETSMKDFPECDLLIVMGTSLVVQPFSSLPDRVEEDVVRVYINKEISCGGDDPVATLMCMDHGFYFDGEEPKKDEESERRGQFVHRDIFLQGECDAKCLELAEQLGWADDLNKLRDAAGQQASHL